MGFENKYFMLNTFNAFFQVGLAGKWQITFLNNRKPFNPVFGVVLHLVETGVHPDQPMFGIFDVEIRKSDGSTFLHAREASIIIF